MSKYIHTSPATDWFFILRDSSGQPPTVCRLAVWAVREDGSVTGLMAVSSAAETGGRMTQTTAMLVEPPPVAGDYKHLSALNDAERAKLGSW